MKQISVTCLLVLFFISCSTENVVNKITYDHEKKDIKYFHGDSIISDNPCVREGSTIEVTINDYNPLIYDLSLEKQANVTYYTTPHQNSLLISYIAAGTGATEEEGLTENNSENADNTANKDKNKECKIITEINSKEKELKQMTEDFKLFYNSIVDLNNTYTRLKYIKNVNEECFCCEINKKIDVIKSNFFKEIKKDTSEKKVADVLQKEAGNCEGCIVDDICGDPVTADAINKNKELYFDYFKSAQDSLISMKANLDKLSNAEKKCKVSETLTKTLAKTLEKITALREEYLSKLSPNIDLIVNNYRSLASLEFVKNYKSFRVEGSDEFTLNLTTKNSLLNSVSTEAIVSLPVVKAIKIDYSGGIFFSGLYDETYNKKIADGETTKYKVSVNDGGNVSYGAMAYVNFHTQRNKAIEYGGSLGAGLMFNQSTKLVLSPTFSVLFGKYQRFIIHIGAAFAQVDRVHSLYGNDSFDDAAYTPEIKRIVQVNGLVGISYNISR
jgi:hypothetical protein